MNKEFENKQVYFVGGGLASLAGAAYLIRDCDFPGKNIHILEKMHILGGSNDGAGNATDGFVCRGGRMLNEETYENTWELLSSIPSLDHEGMSLCDEILAFDHAHPTHANARLINKDGEVLDVMSMGFDNADRLALAKLMITPEEKLDNLRICDWFAQTPHFFETNFWYMWQTTFAFQKWSSLFEFRRYMNRMIFEFSRIQTLEGVTRTPYNQYESIILPMKKYLDRFDVDFSLKYTVTDLDFEEGNGITVTAIHYEQDGKEGIIQLREGDLCIVTNGCMTDNAALGDFHTPAKMVTDKPMSGELWAKIAAKKDGLGNPKPFFGNAEEMLIELLHHLHFEDEIDEIMNSVVNVIPCMMPYIDAQFQPRAMKDGPQVVPEGSTNLALISQFVEIPEDMVFTEEYSIRAARIAVYKLLGVEKKICPVTPHRYDIRTLHKALNTSFR